MRRERRARRAQEVCQTNRRPTTALSPGQTFVVTLLFVASFALQLYAFYHSFPLQPRSEPQPWWMSRWIDAGLWLCVACYGAREYFRTRVSTLRRATIWLWLATLLWFAGAIFLNRRGFAMIVVGDFYVVQAIRFMMHVANKWQRDLLG